MLSPANAAPSGITSPMLLNKSNPISSSSHPTPSSSGIASPTLLNRSNPIVPSSPSSSNHPICSSDLSHRSPAVTSKNGNKNVMSVYLRETPSAEPFNADPELVEILNKNQTIIDTHSPLFILHPTISDDNGTNAQSNISLLHIITFTHLYKFRRFPESEKLYSSEFSKKVKEKYGSSLVYLKARLGFCTLGEDHVSNLRFDRLGCRIEYFCADEGLVDGLDYKVIKNEWPYAIENGYQHLIVWSRLKLLNPALSPSTYHWRLATGEGLSGFVNLSNPMKDRLKSFNLLNKLNEEVQVEDVQSIRLDREIVKFVKNRWKLEEGYSDLIWFLNPVQLQSCPGLPHFHVFVKSQRS